MVVEGLDVRKHTHGVGLVPHDHHVLHLDQTETVSLLPETQTDRRVCVCVCQVQGQLKVAIAQISSNPSTELWLLLKILKISPPATSNFSDAFLPCNQSPSASLLCGGEGQLEVVFSVRGVQRVVIKVQREEGVNQSTESHPVTPAGREVLDVYVLEERRERLHIKNPSFPSSL